MYPMKPKSLPISAKDLRERSSEDVAKILQQLGPKKAEELKYTWEFWARQNQLEPQGNWDFWIFNAGRGAGKTRSGA